MSPSETSAARPEGPDQFPQLAGPSSCLPVVITQGVVMPRSPGRSGYRWRQLRKRLRKPGVVCWICGHPIDLDLAWPDRWSFTVHHIVPLARGGDPLAEDNAVPAHLSCNSRLGDGTKAVVPRTSRLW